MILSDFRTKSCGLCLYYQANFCAVAPNYIGLAHLCTDFKLAEEIEEEEINEIPLIEQLKKDYFLELLSSYTEIETGRTITTFTQTDIDLWIVPPRLITTNHLFRELTQTRALFEYYHNPITGYDVQKSLRKLLEVLGEFSRLAKAKKRKLSEFELPRLLILTPSITENILREFGTKKSKNSGIYFLPPAFFTGLVVIDQL
ncbi:MAG: hypothetical protein FWJ34_19045, partial [Geminocystis sp. GBBB08]|nr:hypothetical protein [Geminocystis sp. GBBB08]